MNDRIVTVIGGSGFVGRHVVRELARAGFRIRVVCRRPAAAAYLKTAGELGQIQVVAGDIAKPESLIPHINGAYAVVNLVGILFESGKQKFATLHTNGAEKIAQACRAARVPVLVHMSSLGVNKASASKYARSKVLGEHAVRAAYPDAVILRPSVIFGPDDNFLNQFAHMAMLSHLLPAVGGGKTRFQPVYVGDIARAVRMVVESPACRGKVFELGGPEVLTFRQLLAYILKVTGLKAHIVPIPSFIASIIGFVVERLPRRLRVLTRDQVRLLKHHNVVDSSAFSFRHLGIHPASMEMVAPPYLSRYGKRQANA